MKAKHNTRQKLLAKKLIENGGNVSKSMVEVGYSKAYAKNPQKITNTKSWEELMEQYLPDEKLQQVHEEGLEATRTISAYSGKGADSTTNDFIDVPDFAVRKQYLELAYKIKSKIKDKMELTGKDGEELKFIIKSDGYNNPKHRIDDATPSGGVDRPDEV